MRTLSPSVFRQVVQAANLAPSVHNTQPTRWRLHEDGSIHLSLDRTRQLAAGDPGGRDARLSCGAALEGTRIALAEIGHGIKSAERLPQSPGDAHSPVLRLEIADEAATDPLAPIVSRRFTWRGGFTTANDGQRRAIAVIAAARDDATLVSDVAEIAMLAEMNDTASLSFFRRRPYREELLRWMRLSRSHPDWARDGLNAESLGMSGFEAAGARIVMRSPVFELLDTLRLSSLFVSESAKTKSAAAIVLFHRSQEEDLLDSGVAFYRLLLSFAGENLSAWPMAVLADDPDRRAEISRRYRLPPERRLINVLRVGALPTSAAPRRARLEADSLIV